MIIKYNNHLIYKRIVRNFCQSYNLIEKSSLIYGNDYFLIYIFFYYKNIEICIMIDGMEKCFYIPIMKGLTIGHHGKISEIFYDFMKKYTITFFHQFLLNSQISK